MISPFFCTKQLTKHNKRSTIGLSKQETNNGSGVDTIGRKQPRCLFLGTKHKTNNLWKCCRKLLTKQNNRVIVISEQRKTELGGNNHASKRNKHIKSHYL